MNFQLKWKNLVPHRSQNEVPDRGQKSMACQPAAFLTNLSIKVRRSMGSAGGKAAAIDGNSGLKVMTTDEAWGFITDGRPIESNVKMVARHWVKWHSAEWQSTFGHSAKWQQADAHQNDINQIGNAQTVGKISRIWAEYTRQNDICQNDIY